MISARNLDYNLARVQLSCRRLVLGLGTPLFSSRAGKHDCASQVISLTEPCSSVCCLKLSYDYRFDPQKNLVSVGLRTPVSVALKSAQRRHVQPSKGTLKSHQLLFWTTATFNRNIRCHASQAESSADRDDVSQELGSRPGQGGA